MGQVAVYFISYERSRSMLSVARVAFLNLRGISQISAPLHLPSLLASLLVPSWIFLSSVTVQAQTLQLPTTSQTSINTTVEVPDGGTIQLGSMGRAGGYSGNRLSTLHNMQTRGRHVTGSGNSVTATIIDLDALDEAILAQPTPPGFVPPYHKDRQALTGRHHPATNFRKLSELPGAWMQALAGDPSLDPNMVPKADVASDIVVLMEQATRARQQGRIAAAEVYYRMVLERLPPRVLDQVEAKVKESLGRKKVVKPL
jgi:hypothetical protein